MKIVEVAGKKFKLPRLSALVGRELMTKGEGLRGILELPLDAQLKFYGRIEVHLLAETWAKLTTVALLENQLPTAEDRQVLLMAFLQYNRVSAEALEQANGPTLLDHLWTTADEILDEVFGEL